MDGLTITVATTWLEIEEYTRAAATCIGPAKTNWATAKESWEKDIPPPIYILLEIHGYKGYIRFLPVAGFLFSDFYTMSGAMPSDRQEVWLEAVRFLGQPCLTNHGSYGGRQLKWLGPMLPYKRVNAQMYSGATIWALYPEEVGGVSKDFVPTPSIPVDC